MKTKPGVQLLFALALIVLNGLAPARTISAAPLAAPIFVNDDVSDGLAAHWKFDEIGSATAVDFSSLPGANPAALINTASMSNASLPALAVPDAAALALNGVNDYAQVPALTSALALNTSFTLTAWVRRTTTGTYDAIYDSGTQANKWWVFIADNSGTKNNRFGFGVRGVLEVYSTQSIVDSNWHFLAVSKSGDTGNNISFFVDGAAAGTAAGGAVNLPSGSAQIGALLEGPVLAQFAGDIDDLRLYNRALSPAELARLAAGQGCVTDGASWATAYRELQCALAGASAGTEIWLAGGTYRPGTGRDVTFNLVNGVNLLGGFVGTETLASQRPAFDPANPLTRLSGDALGDDSAGFAQYGDNSRSVVSAGPGVAAVLDGLAIKDGGNEAASSTGAGVKMQAGALGLTLTNVLVSGSSADGNGGGIFATAPLTLNSVTLSGNQSVHGNGGGLFSPATLTATNLNLLNNKAVSGGGAELSGPAVLTGGLFDSNHAATFNGGAIEASANLTISGATFTNNQAGFSGGAVESSGPTLTVSSAVFTNNHVTVFTGGAIDGSSAMTIATSTFSGNKAPQNGGAIQTNVGDLTVQNSAFSNNQATGSNCSPVCSSGSGGAIADGGGVLNVTNTTFTSNAARLDGGAVLSGAAAAITASNFIDNHAGSPADTGNPGLGKGGAIFGSAGLTLVNSNATSNSARTNGGAIYAAGPLTMNGGNLSLNSAVNGGGLFGDAGGEMTNVLLNANAAATDGGGAFTSGGMMTLSGATFNANSAGRFGGGAHLDAGVVQRSTFTANTAVTEGGGLQLARASQVIASTFSGNSSSLSGAIVMQGTADRVQILQVINSLFSDNLCSSTAGAADMRLFDLTITLANNTFARPGAVGLRSVNFLRSNLAAKNNIWSSYLTSLAIGQAAVGTTLTQDYDLFFNAPLDASVASGPHDLTADPHFANPAGNDFHLKANSPAIDSGDNTILPPGIFTDLDNQPRFSNLPGVPDLGVGFPTVDRGAFEFVVNQVYVPFLRK